MFVTGVPCERDFLEEIHHEDLDEAGSSRAGSRSRSHELPPGRDRRYLTISNRLVLETAALGAAVFVFGDIGLAATARGLAAVRPERYKRS